jgi:hypothetical protein
VIAFSPARAAIAPEPMYRADDAALPAVVIPSQTRDGVELPDPDALAAAIQALQARRQGGEPITPTALADADLRGASVAPPATVAVLVDASDPAAEVHSPPAEACPAPTRRVSAPAPVAMRQSLRVIVAVIETESTRTEPPQPPTTPLAAPERTGGPTDGPTLAPLSNR